MPINPLDVSTKWVCDRCPNTVSSDKIDETLADLSLIVDKALRVSALS